MSALLTPLEGMLIIATTFTALQVVWALLGLLAGAVAVYWPDRNEVRE